MYIPNSSFTVLVENSQEILYESEGVITFMCEVLQQSLVPGSTMRKKNVYVTMC